MSNFDQQLKHAAEEGNIDHLYTIIKDKPSILTDIDSDQFVETPLHIAAYKGHLPFAVEIMNLKPSFSYKLNLQGWSPIHLAIQNQKNRMVLSFVDMNNDLVRVKGREGWTPLHFATQIGDLDILAKFLTACPDSIEDVTVRGETALHIAVKNNNYEALYLLVCFLRKNTKRDASWLEYRTLNQKDEDDNTILHICALNYDLKEMIQLLIKTDINLNAKNLEGKTALDMSIGEEIKKLLSSAGAKPGSQVSTDSPTLADKLKLIVTIEDKVLIYIHRIKNLVLDEQRNTWMIIATLVITATYQSVMSPPGGFYPANAGDNNPNVTSSNSTSTLESAGKSVMSKNYFLGFSYLNMFSFWISMMSILILSPSGALGYTTFMCPMMCFAVSYLYSMWIISPTHYNSIAVGIFYLVFASVAFIYFIISEYSRVQLRNYKKN